MNHRHFERRSVLAGMIATLALFPEAARAAGLGSTLTSLMGQASDNSLDKLSEPGAFYNDKAIRILLPIVGGGLGKTLGSVLKTTDKLGLTDGITRSINDAAGLAAKEAKPVFRSAIDGISFNDVPGIVSEGDGATQYLRRTAGEELGLKVRPLIDIALGDVGAYRQLDSLGSRSSLISAAGLTHDKLGASVTEQAMNGIFKYIGAEERKLRANPLGAVGKAGGLLGDLLGN